MGRTAVEVVGLRGIPGVMGGVEAHCEELYPRMARLAPDLDFEIVARRPFVNGGPRQFQGVTVRPMYAPRKQGAEAIVSTFLGVIRARARGSKLVHIHGIGPALLAPLCRALGMRVIVTYHSVNYDHQKWGGFSRSLFRLGERAAIRFANHVIAVAPWLQHRLQKQYPQRADMISCIPNGSVEFPPSDDGAVLEELALGKDDYVLAVGRLVPEKNLPLLIEAFKRSGSTRKLVIVGGADHDNAFTRSLRAAADTHVIFAGKRNRAALRTLYENAALFVLASTYEGMPIVALEAATLGCPILLSDIDANKDLGLPPQHYFPVGDAGALAERLAEQGASLRTSPKWLKKFDWEEIAHATVSTYTHVLDRIDSA